LNINEQYIKKLSEGDISTLAKCISLVENDISNASSLLLELTQVHPCKVIGITGAPGAGKSTLVNALLKCITDLGKKVAVVSVDPSSPFNMGALLGDRIRMSNFYLNPNVYIRSLASRGALGGLHPRIIEILTVLRSCQFDYILLETVGVGQSEVEIAGIADTTIVVVVPEGGDEVQTMKAGVMEIADIFIVNKADRSGADTFVKNLKALSHARSSLTWEIPVCKTVASKDIGMESVLKAIHQHDKLNTTNTERKLILIAEKAYQIIRQNRMADLDKRELLNQLKMHYLKVGFNIFNFAGQYVSS
jgi:LAO/AO transport system kinase